jgi:hypothetical protein
MHHSKLHNSYSLPPQLIFALFASFAARIYDSTATFRFKLMDGSAKAEPWKLASPSIEVAESIH